MTDDFRDRFDRALVELRADVEPELGARLVDGLTEVAERWPELSPEALARGVARRLPEVEVGRALSELHLADLALVCACDPESPEPLRSAAVRVFDETYRGHLRAVLGRIGDGRAFVEEMLQQVYEHLLVGRADRAPRIGEYTGRGPLLAYVRVVATRVALGDLRRRSRRREDELDDGELQAVVAGDDPELAHLEARYREPMAEAFEAALASLEPRARTLLRYQVVDRLSIDQIGTIYGIHRSTAARQVARARRALVEGTRRHMQQALGVDNEQLESILLLIRSRMDLSVHRLLRDAAVE